MTDLVDTNGPGRTASGGVALIGYRATGKTTIGPIVAARLGRPFLDSDAEIVRRTRKSIAQHFADGDHAAFREVEARTIRDLCRESPGAVLSTGGGAILSGGNREALRRFGLVVWLSTPAPVLVERLRFEGGDRPALTDAGLLDEVASVLEARSPLYRECADVTVHTSTLAPEAVADMIVGFVSMARRGVFP